MIKILNTERIPIKMWLNDIEEGALEQAKNLANLPFSFHHISLMPDAHQGYGMPIGGVLATKEVIIPNAIGTDIGCGMCAVKLPFKYEQVEESLKEILRLIRSRVPTGFNKRENVHHLYRNYIFKNSYKLEYISKPVYYNNIEYYELQAGTLGSGNHFIEIQKDKFDNIWIMIHSGSRKLGNDVAKFYNNLAKEVNEKYYTSVPKEWQLSFFPIDSDFGIRYKTEMGFCIYFAFINRKIIMYEVLTSIEDVLLGNGAMKEVLNLHKLSNDMINIAHNYATIENHFNQTVVVHRKGATSSKNGEVGIIPGSQGSNSYIVVGKGNKDSFMSCSHGAGRIMGRKVAKQNLNLEEEQEKLKNVIHSVRCVDNLDEAPGAYKDINEVMRNQEDLVDIVTKLKPLAVIK